MNGKIVNNEFEYCCIVKRIWRYWSWRNVWKIVEWVIKHNLKLCHATWNVMSQIKANGVCKTVFCYHKGVVIEDTCNIWAFILYLHLLFVCMYLPPSWWFSWPPWDSWLNIDTDHLSLRQEIMSVYKMNLERTKVLLSKRK